jgi:hypothetical protein
MTMPLPEPPVPREADLTHFNDMPLEVRRLRDSAIAAIEDAEAFRCALLLWCASWHRLPAGSLPNDDVELARLAGMGRDLKGWRKRKTEALRHWRLFGDGKLYHPVVTEKVIAAWNSTRTKRWSNECDRYRKENKARKDRGEKPLDLPQKPAGIPYEWPADIREHSDGNENLSDGIPAENALKGREWNGSKKERSRAPPNGAPPDETQKPPPVAAHEGAVKAPAHDIIHSLSNKMRVS